jgi:hypothetical protein
MTTSEAWDAAVEACKRIVHERLILGSGMAVVLGEMERLKGRCPDALAHGEVSGAE